MKEKLKKILSIFTITLLLTFQTTNVWALEAPDPPPPPTLQPAEETQIAPSAPETPTPPLAPTLESAETEENAPEEPNPEDNTTQDILVQDNQQDNQAETTNQDSPGSEANGNVGDTTINTGDALAAGTLTTEANSNTALEESTSPTENSSSVENTNNGSGSTNSASSEEEASTNIIQDNNAAISNDLDLNANTGESSASQNVGDSTIATGDANTSATAVTIANTNLAGLAVSEFNVVDDTQGDLVLDFESGCILGCGIFNPASITTTGNGSDSTNNASAEAVTNNDIFQNNDATLENNVTLSANSGDNQANQNTGGDSEITTGDANVSASVINFLNNNIAGNIVLGVVNIFGDLIGDIILPQEELNSPFASANNIDNGSGSTNSALIDNTIENTTFQTNDALIQNNLDFTANTGGNQTSKNTGGNSTIETGEATIESQTINVANSNIDGGNWWLVLVNEAGQWLGKILESEDGSNIAGSEGTQFAIDPNGDITVTNQDNGAGSTNTASATQSNNNNTVQNNVAQIINNINLFANTGGNSASKNTGGNSTIKTGDANVIANLVNFVNNNISGGGRLTITIVNVFGSWIGNFVTPGTQKEAAGGPIPDEDTNNVAANLPNPPQDQSQNLITGQTPSTNQIANQPQASIQPLASSTSASNPGLNENRQTYVAGIEFDNSNGGDTPLIKPVTNKAENNHKTIELNLAWLLLLLPLGGTVTVIKLKRRLIS